MHVSESIRVALLAVTAFAVAFAAGAAGAAALRSHDPPSRPATASPTPGKWHAKRPRRKRTPRPAKPAPAASAPLTAAELRRFAADVGSGVAIALAPLGEGPVQRTGDAGLRTAPGGHAWSTMKVPILTRLLLDRRGSAHLSAEEHARAQAALTVSDNDAAMALFKTLEAEHGGLEGAAAAVSELFRRSGDPSTHVRTAAVRPGLPSTYGQTLWPADAAVRFMRALARGCLLPEQDTDYVRGLMAGVTAERNWGIGAAFEHFAYKGGWGPEEDGTGLARQMGVVGQGRQAVAIAVVARGAKTEAAEALVTRASAWARRHVGATSYPSATCP